jgi:hypothetical protein
VFALETFNRDLNREAPSHKCRQPAKRRSQATAFLSGGRWGLRNAGCLHLWDVFSLFKVLVRAQRARPHAVKFKVLSAHCDCTV